MLKFEDFKLIEGGSSRKTFSFENDKAKFNLDYYYVMGWCLDITYKGTRLHLYLNDEDDAKNCIERYNLIEADLDHANVVLQSRCKENVC